MSRILASGCLSLLLALFALSPRAATPDVLEREVDRALEEFARYSPAAMQLVDRAAGVLVFPGVMRMGLFLGGQYGEGALRVNGETVQYYTTTGASFGFQFGVERKSHILLFMTQGALDDFRRGNGWEAGIDGSVALSGVGAGGSFDSNTFRETVVGFIFSNEGIMLNLSLGGARIAPVER